MGFLQSSDPGETRLLDLSVDTDSSGNVVSTSKLKTYLDAADYTDHDTLIDDLENAAQEWIEDFCQITLLQKTYIATWMDYHINLALPKPPISSITHVKIIEDDGTKTELTTSDDDYIVLGTDRQHIHFNSFQRRPLEVKYVAGYSSASDVPDVFVDAIKRIVSTSYDNRADIDMAEGGERQVLEIPKIVKDRLKRKRMIRI